MWNEPPLIFEGESEEALIADFVKYSAIYRDRSNFEIAEFVFRGLRDPSPRCMQAAMIWSKDLQIQERIRLAIVNGPELKPAISFENWQAKVLEVTESERITAQDKKATLDGYKLLAESNGWIKKVSEESKNIKVADYSDLVQHLPN